MITTSAHANRRIAPHAWHALAGARHLPHHCERLLPRVVCVKSSSHLKQLHRLLLVVALARKQLLRDRRLCTHVRVPLALALPPRRACVGGVHAGASWADDMDATCVCCLAVGGCREGVVAIAQGDVAKMRARAKQRINGGRGDVSTARQSDVLQQRAQLCNNLNGLVSHVLASTEVQRL